MRNIKSYKLFESSPRRKSIFSLDVKSTDICMRISNVDIKQSDDIEDLKSNHFTKGEIKKNRK